MLKNLAGLECKVGEEVINLTCGSQCPLTHIKEALFQFLKHIGQIEDAAKIAQEKEQEKEQEKVCSETQEESKITPDEGTPCQ